MRHSNFLASVSVVIDNVIYPGRPMLDCKPPRVGITSRDDSRSKIQFFGVPCVSPTNAAGHDAEKVSYTDSDWWSGSQDVLAALDERHVTCSAVAYPNMTQRCSAFDWSTPSQILEIE